MRAGRRTFFSVVRDDSKSVSLVPNMATVPGHVSRPEDSVQCLLEGGARCRTHLKANSVVGEFVHHPPVGKGGKGKGWK